MKLPSVISNFKWYMFLIGAVFGLIVVQFYKPEKSVIVEYPHPKETDSKVFRDRNGTCYSYSSHEVDCDANEATLKDYPLQ